MVSEADEIGQKKPRLDQGSPLPANVETHARAAQQVSDAPNWFAQILGPGLSASIAIALSERRLFVAAPILMIFGLCASVGLAHDPSVWALWVLGVVLMGLLFAVRRNFAQWQIILGTLIVWIGICLPSAHGALFGSPMLAYPAYGHYEMTIDEIISADAKVQRVVVSGIKPLTDARALPIKRARVFARNGPTLGVGDIIDGNFRFAPVPSPVVPGGFDFQFHAYFDGIGSYASSTSALRVVERGGPTPGRWLETIRQAIGARIDLALEQPTRGVARALIIGDQSLISDQSRDMMAAAGLAHVLAISGLHLTLVAGGVFFAIRAGLALSYGLGQRLSVKKLAAVTGMITAVFYLLLSGSSVSATRATIMLLLVFGAVLAGRRALTMRNVAIAALIVIVFDPAAVFRPGFQLSFAAVGALIAVYEMTRIDRKSDQGVFDRIARFFGGMALTSIIAGLATLLFAAYHFQQTAPLGVLGNIVALPIVGFVVLPACFIAVLLMPLGLEAPLLQVMGLGTEIILLIANKVATWSAPLAASPLLNSWSLIIGIGALGWLVFFPTRIRFAGPLASIPLIMLVGLDTQPDVLVADSSQAVAVRVERGLALMSGRAPSFATTAWQETYMQPIVDNGLQNSCDNAACIGRGMQDFSVAVVKRQDAFAEDCRLADLVVTRLRVPKWCRTTTLVIDAQDLRLSGMHWLQWHNAENGFEVRPSIANPNRSWRIPF